jgi:hypothetical protein
MKGVSGLTERVPLLWGRVGGNGGGYCHDGSAGGEDFVHHDDEERGRKFEGRKRLLVR